MKKENVYSRAAVHLVSSEEKKKRKKGIQKSTNPKHRKGSQSSAGRNLPPEEKEKNAMLNVKPHQSPKSPTKSKSPLPRNPG